MILFWLIWAWSLAPDAAPANQAAIRQALWTAGRTAAFRAPTAIERAALAAAIPEVLAAAQSGGDPQVARARLAAIDLRLGRWIHKGRRYLVVHEAPGAARGAGAYLFRVQPRPARLRVLQTPHSYFDRHTGALGVALFFDAPDGAAPAALFVNTLHRYQRGPRVDRHPADPCDGADHLFSVATEALARAHPATTVLQLHGFARRLERPTSAVISGGLLPAPKAARALAARLRPELPDLALFPDDVDFLGALENAQARALRAIPGATFLHLELDEGVRARLRAERAPRQALAWALFGPGAP